MPKIITQLAILGLLLSSAYAQTPATFPSSTLPNALAQNYVGPIQLASNANVFPPGLPGPPSGGIGEGTGQSLTILFVDSEAMCVQAIQGPYLIVERGCQGTPQQAHNAGAKVWINGSQFYRQYSNPSGACSLANIPFLPVIVIDNATFWNCVNSVWVPFSMMAKHQHKQNFFQRTWEKIKTHLKGIF